MTLRLAFAFVLAFVLFGCKHVPPPYPRGQAPSPDTLMAATKPQVDAIAVPRATVVANRIARGDLALIAQAPSRFRGSVTKAGNELVTLSLHEEGYALRYKLDAFPQGYYEGPPDPCAVAALIGVELAPEGLVALVLGGSPVIADYEIVRQQWNRKEGHEELLITNARYVQQLNFDWVDGQWLFSGGELFAKDREPSRFCRRRDPGELIWALDHEDFGRVDGAILPKQTRVRSPGRRRDNLVVITYRERELNPPWAQAPAPDEDGTDDGGSGWEDGGWEGEADAWEEGEWETGDETEAPAQGEATAEGAEPAEGETPSESEGPQKAKAPAEGETPAEPAKPDEPKQTPPQKPASTPVPQVFLLQPTGLAPRGDLCK